MNSKISPFCLIVFSVFALSAGSVLAASHTGAKMDSKQPAPPPSAAPSAAAAAAAPKLNQVNTANQHMDKCADIANKMSAMPAPKEHGKARGMAAANMQNPNSKTHMPIDPEHARFNQFMMDGVKALQACGMEFQNSRQGLDKIVNELGDAIDKKAFNENESRTVGAAIVRYHKSRENLVKAIGTLSKDKEVQSYVSQTLVDHFLK